MARESIVGCYRAEVTLASRLRRAGAAAALLALGCGARPPRFTNLVVIVIDTLRSDHLPMYGYERETSPVMRRLAAEGVQLQGYAASSWTKPSVASMFSGLVPQRHQAISLNDRLPEEAPYLPALLSERGFTTFAFIGNASNLGGRQGFRRGFTESKQWIGPPKIHAAEVNRRTFALLGKARPPYFLWVHYVDPHDPYEPPSPWPAGASEQAPGTSRQGAGTYPVQPQVFAAAGTMPSAVELVAMRDQYDGEIVEVDRAIGELIDRLKASKLLDHTLVVVTSDHGEEFAEHRQLMHGQSLHEELLRVPLILWAAEDLPRLHSDAAFWQVDFLPTVLEALGVPEPPGIDGESCWSEIGLGKAPRQRPMSFHLDRHEGASLARLEWPLKLIERWGEPDELLFDLDRDPDEARPLPKDDRRVAGLRERVFAWHGRGSRDALPRSGRNVDKQLKEQLAALGYLRGGGSPRALAGRRLPLRLDPGQGLGSQAAPPD
jgi:arylsulfatase A-like enzyme